MVYFSMVILYIYTKNILYMFTIYRLYWTLMRNRFNSTYTCTCSLMQAQAYQILMHFLFILYMTIKPTLIPIIQLSWATQQPPQPI